MKFITSNIGESKIDQGKLKSRKYLLNTIILFFTVYSIHFKNNPLPITPRIFFMLVVILVINFKNIINNKIIKIRKDDLAWIVLTSTVLIYSVIIVAINDLGKESLTILNGTFNFFIFIAIFPILAEKLFIDAKHFSSCLTYAAVIQSVIVISSFLFPQVRQLLSEIQNLEMWRYNWRVIGLGVVGAGGSIYLFTGLIAAGYLVISGEKDTKLFLNIFIIIIAIALIGRTGFYASLLWVSYLIFVDIKKIHKKFVSYLKVFIVLLLLITIIYIGLDTLEYNTDLLYYTYERLGEIFVYGFESPTLSAISDSEASVPGLSFETLIGTGIRRGTTASGLVFNSDSGYIQRYAALGVFVAMFSYISFIWYIIKMSKYISKVNKRYILFMLALLLIIEYKEPFIYMLAYPFTLVMIIRINQRELNKKKY